MPADLPSVVFDEHSLPDVYYPLHCLSKYRLTTAGYSDQPCEGGWEKDALYLPKKRDEAESKERRAKRRIISESLKEDGFNGTDSIRLLPRITKERRTLNN